MDQCLRSRHYVNVVVADKHPVPQWLTMDAAVKHCSEGIGIWQWAGNDQAIAPDLVMACCGVELLVCAFAGRRGQHCYGVGFDPSGHRLV